MTIRYVNICPFDVLSGKNSTWRTHCGNKNLRKEVESRYAEYEGCGSADKKKKTRISQEVVDAIANKNGRFLRLINHKPTGNSVVKKEDTLWEVLDDTKARDIVASRFRDVRTKKKKAEDANADANEVSPSSPNAQELHQAMILLRPDEQLEVLNRIFNHLNLAELVELSNRIGNLMATRIASPAVASIPACYNDENDEGNGNGNDDDDGNEDADGVFRMMMQNDYWNEHSTADNTHTTMEMTTNPTSKASSPYISQDDQEESASLTEDCTTDFPFVFIDRNTLESNASHISDNLISSDSGSSLPSTGAVDDNSPCVDGSDVGYSKSNPSTEHPQAREAGDLQSARCTFQTKISDDIRADDTDNDERMGVYEDEDEDEDEDEEMDEDEDETDDDGDSDGGDNDSDDDSDDDDDDDNDEAMGPGHSTDNEENGDCGNEDEHNDENEGNTDDDDGDEDSDYHEWQQGAGYAHLAKEGQLEEKRIVVDSEKHKESPKTNIEGPLKNEIPKTEGPTGGKKIEKETKNDKDSDCSNPPKMTEEKNREEDEAQDRKDTEKESMEARMEEYSKGYNDRPRKNIDEIVSSFHHLQLTASEDETATSSPPKTTSAEGNRKADEAGNINAIEKESMNNRTDEHRKEYSRSSKGGSIRSYFGFRSNRDGSSTAIGAAAVWFERWKSRSKPCPEDIEDDDSDDEPEFGGDSGSILPHLNLSQKSACSMTAGSKRMAEKRASLMRSGNLLYCDKTQELKKRKEQEALDRGTSQTKPDSNLLEKRVDPSTGELYQKQQRELQPVARFAAEKRFTASGAKAAQKRPKANGGKTTKREKMTRNRPKRSTYL